MCLRKEKILIFLFLSMLFIVTVFANVYADEEERLMQSYHEHECEYQSDGEGFHIVKCRDEECSYEEKEECTYVKTGDNTYVCSACKNVKPLYLLKEGHSQELILKSGETSKMNFILKVDADSTVKETGLAQIKWTNGSIDTLMTEAYCKADSRVWLKSRLSGITDFKELVLKTLNKKGYDENRIAQGMFLSDISGSNLRLSYDSAKNKDENYIDMSDYDTAVIEYKSDNKGDYAPVYVRFCGCFPIKTECIDMGGGEYLYRHIYNIKALKEKEFDSNSYGKIECYTAAFIEFAHIYDVSVYLENTGQIMLETSFHATIESDPLDVSTYYGDTVIFLVNGDNFSTNSRWYYFGKDKSDTAIKGDEDFVVDMDNSTRAAMLTIKADRYTDDMQFYFKTKGSDDLEYICSNPAKVSILDDPVTNVRINRINAPIAGEPLDKNAEIEFTTYKGNVISSNSLIKWKNSGCTNENPPELTAGKVASNNTYYTAQIRCKMNERKNERPLNPFIDGEFNVVINRNKIDKQYINISDGLDSIEIEYGKGAKDYMYKDIILAKPDDYNAFERTKPFATVKKKIYKKSVKCDENFEFSMDSSKIIEAINFENGNVDEIYIEKDKIITNQNNFLLNEDKISEGMICISGMPTRSGVVYEAEFSIISANYEKIVLDFILMAQELEKEGRYGTLNSPGLYDKNNKLLYDWNTLVDLNLIDCSDSVLYEVDEKISKAGGNVLVLSRKLSQIRKDAFINADIPIVEFDNNITRIGNGGLSGISRINYEGSVRDFNELIANTNGRISNSNITISFIDYKEVVPEIKITDNVYDGNKKVAESVNIYLAEDTEYTYYVNQNELKNLNYSTKNVVESSEYLVTYKDNKNAGIARISIVDRGGKYEYEYEFLIKKAKAVAIDSKEYEYTASAFSPFDKKFYLQKDMPSDAGSILISSKPKIKIEEIEESIDDDGVLILAGMGQKQGIIYENDFVITSTNYEDLTVTVKIMVVSYGKGKGLIIDGEEIDFLEATNKKLIGIDDQGYINYISPVLTGTLNIPDSISTEIYSGNINGFSANSLSQISIDALVMEDNLHIKDIPKNLFLGNRKIKAVILPESLENIGEKSFGDCASLSVVYIPANVSTIGRRAFMNDISIMPASKTNYGLRLLEGKLSTLEDSVFEGAVNISDFNNPFRIPANVIKIEKDALTNVKYIEYLGNEEIIKDQICKGFNYDGQRFLYPYDVGSIKLNKTDYEYENKPVIPEYTVYSKADAYIYYEDNGKEIIANRENIDSKRLEDTIISSDNLQVKLINNNGAGIATIEVLGCNGYSGTASLEYRINKGSLSKLINSEKTFINYCDRRKGNIDIKLSALEILEGINLGEEFSTDFSEVEKSDETSYELINTNCINISCNYSLKEENKKTPLRVFSAVLTIKSPNYDDYSVKLNEDIYLAKEEVLVGKGKNARISSYVDEQGNLVYTVTEQVGCMINLNDVLFDIKDYLPAVIKDDEVTLLGMDYDKDDISVTINPGGYVIINGNSEYPNLGMLNSKYKIAGSESGDFFCEFIINSVKPTQIYVNQNVYTNMSLKNTTFDLCKHFPEAINKDTISFISASGIYRGKAEYNAGKVTLSDMVACEGRIFDGYYTAADSNYQSYRLKLTINAVDAVVSTVKEEKVMLTNGMYAQVIPGYIYTGKKITPVPKIVDNTGRMLTYKKDYIVKYYNNKNANVSPNGESICQKYDKKTKSYIKLQPYMEITFKRDYKKLPKQVINFYIFQKDLSNYNVQLQNEKAIKKILTQKKGNVIKSISDEAKKKIKNTDYKSECLPITAIDKQVDDNTMQYAIKISGINNYCGYSINYIALKAV